MRYGIFGGGFNPPHMAHVLGAAYAISRYNLDLLFVSPCWDHPFEDKEPTVDWEHRAEMCRLAFSSIKGARVPLWEREIQPQYTVDLLELILPTLPGVPHLILGSDNIADQSKWRRWDDVLKLVQGNLITLPRGTGLLPNISSSMIRYCISIMDPDKPIPPPMFQLVPAKVLEYIRKHNLYV